jgi:endo-1,4-beta-mannosidase
MTNEIIISFKNRIRETLKFILNKKPYTKVFIRYRPYKNRCGLSSLKPYNQKVLVLNKPKREDFKKLQKDLINYIKVLGNEELILLSNYIVQDELFF